jgi:hypothetical protein
MFESLGESNGIFFISCRSDFLTLKAQIVSTTKNEKKINSDISGKISIPDISFK